MYCCYNVITYFAGHREGVFDQGTIEIEKVEIKKRFRLGQINKLVRKLPTC